MQENYVVREFKTPFLPLPICMGNPTDIFHVTMFLKKDTVAVLPETIKRISGMQMVYGSATKSELEALVPNIESIELSRTVFPMTSQDTIVSAENPCEQDKRK